MMCVVSFVVVVVDAITTSSTVMSSPHIDDGHKVSYLEAWGGL